MTPALQPGLPMIIRRSLAATTKFEFLNSSNSILLVLEEGDKLQVTCSTTGGLNLIVSALEISRS